MVELRNRVLWFLCFWSVASVAGYFLFPWLLGLIEQTLGERLYITKIYEGFVVRMQMSVLLGLILSIPVFSYHLMAYVLPGLTGKERVFVLFVLIFSYFLLFGGGFLALEYLLPWVVTFLKSEPFFAPSLTNLIAYDGFVTFLFQSVLACCVVLQFPVLLLLLLYFNFIKVSFLIQNFKYAIPLALLVSALIAPDIISQLILSVPLLILLGFCIVLAKVFRWGT